MRLKFRHEHEELTIRYNKQCEDVDKDQAKLAAEVAHIDQAMFVIQNELSA